MQAPVPACLPTTFAVSMVTALCSEEAGGQAGEAPEEHGTSGVEDAVQPTLPSQDAIAPAQLRKRARPSCREASL